ncbi:MAG: FdtA/QdtA family cupin domain-containing protein [Prochlorococcaceae cyanobacterium]
MVVTQACRDLALLLRLPSVHSESGRLTPLELPGFSFTPIRMFLVHGLDGASRGGHAHRWGRQLLVRTAGSITLKLRMGCEEEVFELNAENNACLISAPVWSSQTYHGDQACLAVLCDSVYDPDSYVDAAQ